MAESSPSFLRRWLLQIGGLSAGALALFSMLYCWDIGFDSALGLYFDFQADTVADATAALGGLSLAVFGIVITVVSIIVQLSADRFTGVTRMFFADKRHLAVMTFYIILCIYGVWLSTSLHSEPFPRVALGAMLLMSTVGLAMMAPYFGYVFWFLEPINIIARIRSRALKAVQHDAHHPDDKRSYAAQARVLSSLEELTDISSNSIGGKDKIIASGAVDALKDFALEYIARKGSASDAWFSIGPEIRNNPDFVAMDPESLTELEQRRTWVEWKVMRQYLGIYNEALAQMRDINYLIAIDTRYIGEAALASNDDELLRLVYRFMNSYLRTTLNTRDVRTAYNVLNQYRLLVEAMLRGGAPEVALEGIGYMKYYGHVSFDQKLPFITETVAYDVSALCEIAYGLGLEQERAMLVEFLDLDRPLPVQAQEKALLGVRKAQVKLACFYLAKGEKRRAEDIAQDMASEPKERISAIRQQLETVRSKDFWEIIDRGRNFEYMPEEQRQQLSTFFEWFGAERAASELQA